MSQEQIDFNKLAHNQVASKYDKVHTEIFNEVEQNRLRESLKLAKETIPFTEETLSAFDVGCGSGNLTSHLLSLGFKVTAADISNEFLLQIENKYEGVKTHELNGEDLSEIADDTYDMVATYSVLHHIPDYLKMVGEMCRVLKPGGVLYLDHEKNEHFWNNEAKLQEFYKTQRFYLLPSKLKKLFNPMWYAHRYRRLRNPRYQAEGDIHVWPDDHVEWQKVYQVCQDNGVSLLHEIDFLLYDERYDKALYQKYSSGVTDTRAAILSKLV